jgi:tetratricopeptide (TPR) repeat protein
MSDPRPAGAAQQVRLEQISLPRLLFALLRQRFTGQLRLEQAPLAGDAGPTVRTVWFRGGMPVFTDWASPELVLGQLMLRDRLIDDAQLTVALRAMAERGGLLGETLVAQGFAERRTVMEGLRRQCAAKLVEVFALRRGTIEVTSGHDGSSSELLEVNVLELIASGVSTHYDAERIRSEMRATLDEPLGATAAFQRYRAHFRFRDDDARTIEALCKGGARLDKLEKLSTSPVRALRLVYVLWACQMLKVGAPTGVAQTSRRASPASASPSPASPARDEGRRSAQSAEPATAAPAAAVSSTVSTSPKKAAGASGDEAAAAPDDPFEVELAALEQKVEAEAHPFELLGIPLSAGKKEIRRAFSDLSRTFHPDGLQARGLGHLRERVSAAFAALSEAQMLLGDKDKREELRKAIERGEDPKKSASNDAAVMARAAFESEVIARDADKLLRAGRFDRALEHYERAVELTPDEADYHAAIAWCRYNLSDKSAVAAATAEARLAEVVEANPKLARAQYFRGLVLIDLGRDDAAINSLTRAHQHDPRLVDAERQARILRMRKKSGTGSTSGRGKPESNTGRFTSLKGLFGKK